MDRHMTRHIDRRTHRIDAHTSWPLHGVAASRELERLTQSGLPEHQLMQRAGASVAQLARAIAPHARRVWIACGPGNNGGDGFEAGWHLQQVGWQVCLTWTGPGPGPRDAQASRARAIGAGLQIQEQPPQAFDLAIDALLGLGGDLSQQRPGSEQMVQWLTRMHSSGQPVLAVDLPSGLHGDTGQGGLPAPRQGQRHTLSLLSLKPGLFTARGRDQAGQVWFDALGADLQAIPATAELIGADRLPRLDKARGPHDSHKGSFGDVMVIGGAQRGGSSMAGAAVLAARAALHSGAGRVYLHLLGEPTLDNDPVQPELMFRSSLPADDDRLCLVCGCGGGTEVAPTLPEVLGHRGPLVLDADALNAIALDPPLQRQLRRRAKIAQTVLTPHPLEAARLLGCGAEQVQHDRVRAAQTLAEQWACTVVLKGSGSIVAQPDRLPQINPTGNALLASAGTGDVLAGMIGAAMAHGLDGWQAARLMVHRHGARADARAAQAGAQSMTASELLQARDPC
jgi:hydroxyethylthiazole kinase-like uncharacterized protein yjeF